MGVGRVHSFLQEMILVCSSETMIFIITSMAQTLATPAQRRVLCLYDHTHTFAIIQCTNFVHQALQVGPGNEASSEYGQEFGKNMWSCDTFFELLVWLSSGWIWLSSGQMQLSAEVEIAADHQTFSNLNGTMTGKVPILMKAVLSNITMLGQNVQPNPNPYF
jgi:hypothetical protein